MIIKSIFSALLVFAIHSDAATEPQSLLYTVPFKAGDEGAKIYRIPAIWYQPQKPLLAFAERRVEQRRMTGDVDIVLKRSFDQGETWERMQVISDLGRDTCGNPCIVQDPSNGRLWLAFTLSRNQDTEEQIVTGKAPGTQVWICHSDDDGGTWSVPANISESTRHPQWGWYGTGPGHGLFLKGDSSKPDRLLFPAYHTEGDVYHTHTIYSEDHGNTWNLGSNAAANTSEPQIIEMDNHSLLMNARTIHGHGNQRTHVISTDRGTTWKAADNVAPLDENDCQGALYRCFRSGSESQYDWIFSHPNSPRRADVHAWISEDGGKTWPNAQKLWSGPSAYTAMVRVQGGLVGMLVECGVKDVYEQIAFVKFSPEWLKAQKAPAPKKENPAVNPR